MSSERSDAVTTPPEFILPGPEMPPDAMTVGSEAHAAWFGTQTAFYETLQYEDGFLAYPDRSSNDCPHPGSGGTADLARRRRWMTGYMDRCILEGVVGNATEDDLEAVVARVPSDLLKHAADEATTLTKTAAVATVGEHKVAAAKARLEELRSMLEHEATLETVTAATGTPDSHERAMNALVSLETEIGSW